MKHYDNGAGLNEKILNGINTLADNVASTLGPRGRNVILQAKTGNPVVTKDGVTVANFVELSDPFENVGAQIVKQAAAQTNTNAGDGTTTATVLTRAIIKQAQKYIQAGTSPNELKKGINKAVDAVVVHLRDNSREITSIEDIEHIATISANGDDSIGKLIAMAVDQVGKDGSITVEEARSLDTTLDLVEGFRFDSGYVATAFITDERRGLIRYDNPMFLVTDHKVESVEQLLPTLELAARESRPLIVVADEVDGQALAALIMNTLRGSLKVAAVKAPRYGEERRSILRDLALSVGAHFITRESGVTLPEIKLTHLGQAKSVEVQKYQTTVVGGKGDIEEVDKRIEAIKSEISQTEDLRECELLQERITRLASGIAILKIGAATEIEMIEKKHRVEDALEAVRSAQLEGVVCGGGLALLRAAQAVDISASNEEQAMGAEVVKRAIREPLRQMADNAGESPDIVQSLIEAETGSNGYDFTTGEVVDMFRSGIIDPLKVTRSAVQNAASVATTLITTNFAIIERD